MRMAAHTPKACRTPVRRSPVARPRRPRIPTLRWLAVLIPMAAACAGSFTTSWTRDANPDGAAPRGGAGRGSPAAAPCARSERACRARFDVASGRIPYYRSHSLEELHPEILNLIVIVHGAQRHAGRNFATVAGLAAGRDPIHTAVLAPHFQTARHRRCFGARDTPARRDLYWSCNEWKDGLAAMNDAQASSFRCLDALIAAAKAVFPRLQTVTVAGHSAGGQFVQRYAAGSKEPDRTPGIETRYVVANPSSYMYLDARRLKRDARCDDADHCPLDDGSFEAPYYNRTGCPNYDVFKYGLRGRSGYLAEMTDSELRSRYVARRVVYLLGEADSGPTTEALYGELDRSCAAVAQGPRGASFRLQRGLVYHQYVTRLFRAPHRLRVVPGCGHDEACVFSSDAGVDELFR